MPTIIQHNTAEDSEACDDERPNANIDATVTCSRSWSVVQLFRAVRSTVCRSSCRCPLLLAIVCNMLYFVFVCVVFHHLEDPSWSILDSIYYGTVVMVSIMVPSCGKSTVGYGDLTPTATSTRTITVVMAFVGIPVFSQALWLIDHIVGPILEISRAKMQACIPPTTAEVDGLIDDSKLIVIVPTHALSYYFVNLLPSIILWLSLQFAFAAFLCAAQPIGFGLALYHMMITSTTVGLGDVSIETDEAKIVAISHILLTVGTLAATVQSAYLLRKQRKKMIDRWHLMMRKTDPNLLKDLHASYTEASEVSKQRQRRLSLHSRQHEDRNATSCSDGLQSGSLASTDGSMDKAEFVVSVLVALGVLEWKEAMPVMKHFDQLDVRKCGKLKSSDLVTAHAKQSLRRLGREKLLQLAEQNGVSHLLESSVNTKAEKLEMQGDYSAAAKAYEENSRAALTDSQIVEIGPEAVRESVWDRIKQAELIWRYRVVEDGKSIYEEALRFLSSAERLVDHCTTHCAAQGLWSAPSSSASMNNKSRSHHLENVPQSWYAESSAILHGKGVALFIHGRGAPDQPQVESFLQAALKLRQESDLRMETADTLNSLGELKKIQKAYVDAENCFSRSLALRRDAQDEDLESGSGTTKEQKKQQAIAQSLVSLGNLAIEQGDEVVLDSDEAYGSKDVFYNKAREYHEAAKQAYIAGFHAQHPKVAWSIEGLAKVYERQGDLKLAIGAYHDANEIRRALQATDNEKQLFAQEIRKSEELQDKLQRRSQTAAQQNQLSWRLVGVASKLGMALKRKNTVGGLDKKSSTKVSIASASTENAI